MVSAQASQEELDRMIDEIDVDGDGTINFEGAYNRATCSNHPCARV